MLAEDRQKELAIVKSVIGACLLITKQLRLYGSANRQVAQATARLLGFLEAHARYQESLQLTIARHGFLYEDGFVERQNDAFAGFAYLLFQHGISAITFEHDLPAGQVQDFFSLTGRSPAETWQEGGITAALRMREIDAIAVREMSEDDIAYLDGVEQSDRELLLREQSPLWDRFALAVYRGLDGPGGAEIGDAEFTPASLAGLANRVLDDMSDASRQKFGKGLSSFLAAIQAENVSRYRSRALARLTEFINRISPEIRTRLFSNIFNLNMKPAFSEEFFAGLADEVIVELLGAAAKDSDYAPPLIMKLLGKLAQDKKLDVAHFGQVDQQLAEKKREIAKLFKKDDFEKYVPDKYRDALLNIIRFDNVPRQVDANLLELKGSIEEEHQEQHTADIILLLLEQPLDENFSAGIDEKLVQLLSRYLADGAYHELNELHALLKRQGARAAGFDKFSQALSSAKFTNAVVAAISRHGKRRFDDIEALVRTVGTPFVEPLLHALAEDGNRANRVFYLKLLRLLDAAVVIPMAAGYLDDRRWFVVRNIIHLLRSIQDPLVLPYVRPFLDHPHLKTRIEALRTCLQYGCAEATGRLVEMLDAKDNATVDTAISLAIMVRDAQVAGRLIALLQSNPVLNYRLEQKKAIVKTLVETVPKGSLPVFFAILAKKNNLHPVQHKELTEEILKVFERYDRKLLAPAIARHAASLNADLLDRLKTLPGRIKE